MLNATIDKSKNELIIRVPLERPRPSSTGKMDLVVNTGGFKPLDVEVDGRALKVSVMAGMKR